MNILRRFKERLFCRILDKRKQKYPFNQTKAELFETPPNADEYHNNSYYFSCHDMAGNSLLLRHGIRGVDKTEVWLAYKDAQGNTYINEKQLYIKEKPSSAVECIEVAKTWGFSFSGKLINMETGIECDAVINGEFTATGDIFEFGYHLDSRVMAKAIAKEKWSRAFFNALKENNQVHYEQPGKALLSIAIDGKNTQLSVPAVRDHSFGKRDWKYMNKHFWLMGLFEDGSHLNANMVSYPAVKRIETGYYVSDSTVCVEEAKLIGDLPKSGVPKEFTYSAALLGGNELKVDCKLEAVFGFPFGGYTIYEGIGSFEYAGKKGRGILEFGYNDDPERVSGS